MRIGLEFLRAILGGVLGGLIFATAPAQTGYAQEAAPTIPANSSQAPPDRQPKFLGGNRCIGCHSADPAAKLLRDFCQLDEALIFGKQDKHQLAYQALKAELSSQIEEALAVGGKAKVDAWQDARCLGCHLGTPLEPANSPTNTALSCEACHGPSEFWDQPHSHPSLAWRALAATEKEKLGLIDLRHPVKRAKVCFSCHIGNEAESKVVTHAMYAGGHPPLTSIEIVTFSEAMPRHWKTLRDKGDFEKRKDYVAANPGIDDPLRNTKSTLVGGIMAMSHSVQLLSALAQKGEYPEWAVYDCQACHHELQLPAWRQTRRPLGRPGRPRPAEWLAALLFASGDQASWRKPVDEGLAAMHAALDIRPFGEPDSLVVAINGDAQKAKPGLVQLLNSRAEAIVTSPLDLKAVSRELYSLEGDFLRDFHSARQVGWAIRVIETELRVNRESAPLLPRLDTETDANRIAREKTNQARLEDWRKNSLAPIAAEINTIMAPIDSYLSLKLTPEEKDFVKTSLQKMRDYDPREFQKLLREAYKQSAIREKQVGAARLDVDDLKAPRRR